MNEIVRRKLINLKAELNLILKTEIPLSKKWAFCRKFFSRFVNTLSSEQNIAFKNFYSKCRYTISKLNIDEIDVKNFDSLRRFCKKNFQETNIEDITQFAFLFNLAFNRIEGKKTILRNDFKREYFSLKYPTYQDDSEIRILCNNWTPLSKVNGRIQFELYGYDLENLTGLVKVFITDSQHSKLSYIYKLLEKGMILRLENLALDKSQVNAYSTTFSTLISLEPDFLIDATGIGECFQFNRATRREAANSTIFIFSRLMDDLPGEAALKGSIVGYYLDEMICGQTSFHSTFESAKQTYPLRSAQFGNNTMNQIKKSINIEHLPNLQRLVNQENQPNKKLWIEPTFFSAEYGIQGRIDLLGLNDNSSKDIIELKSGSPSNPNYSIAWPGHKYQVVNYDLLLDSTYGENRRGSNSVYYSRCQISPYRNIVSENKEKQNSLFVRNRIIRSIYKLSQNDFSLLNNISDNGIPFLPRFSESALSHFQTVYKINDLAKGYYNEMIAFVLRELINAKVGGFTDDKAERKQNGFASLWLNSMEEKKDEFAIIHELKITNIDKKNGHITLYFSKPIPHSFRKKDLVVLYPKSNEKYDALTQHILKGSISQINSSYLTISLYNKQTDYSFLERFKFWAIESDIFERNYWSTISNLFNVLTSNERKLNLLLGKERPTTISKNRYVNKNLNENQNTLINKALCSKDYFLLQGPPGTGKTSTFLINYISEIIKSEEDQIIVLAFTNKAVDKICENLRQPRTGNAINYIRLGSKHTEDEYFFNTLATQTSNNPNDWRKIIESTRVIVSTVATFQNKCLLLQEFTNFNQVIVDEASQLTEAHLSGVITQFDKFVLIGDQKQLPAVITQNEIGCKVKDVDLYEHSINDLRISLFERLFENAKNKEWHHCIGQLTTHYRMHESIAKEISRHYEKKLIAGRKEQKTQIPIYKIKLDGINENIGNNRLVFIECKPEALPKKNTQEAKVCAAIVSSLLHIGYNAKDIGIITPFRAQITEIKKQLPEDLLDNENFIVDTVERFQGDERKIIIYSTTVANKSQLGSMQSIAPNDDKHRTDRKLLVSISRASEQYIMLGNSKVLESSEDYANLIESIKRENSFYIYKE